jgi:hypothetical protein
MPGPLYPYGSGSKIQRVAQNIARSREKSRFCVYGTSKAVAASALTGGRTEETCLTRLAVDDPVKLTCANRATSHDKVGGLSELALWVPNLLASSATTHAPSDGTPSYLSANQSCRAQIAKQSSRSRGRSGTNIWLLVSKVIDSLAVGYPFSIVHLPEFENQRRILFK